MERVEQCSRCRVGLGGLDVKDPDLAALLLAGEHLGRRGRCARTTHTLRARLRRLRLGGLNGSGKGLGRKWDDGGEDGRVEQVVLGRR